MCWHRCIIRGYVSKIISSLAGSIRKEFDALSNGHDIVGKTLKELV
jgi:hypothetical protein